VNGEIIVKITKQIIVDALKTEPLTANEWTSPDGCRGCAVGTILRKITTDYRKVNKMSLELTANQCIVGDTPIEGNIWSQMSCYWETLVQEYVESQDWTDYEMDVKDFDDLGAEDRHAVTEHLRPQLVQWAQDSIPNDFNQILEISIWC
jgi:hypothetical protein